MKVELPIYRGSNQPNYYANGYIDANWWPEIKLDLNLTQLAADFYLFYAMKDSSPYLQEKFEEFSQISAKQLAIYLDTAVGGELRHIGYKGLVKGSGRSIARRDWRRLRTQHDGPSVLEDGAKCFYSNKWSSGYGGPKWGAIADLLVSHLKGEISNTLFVDQAFACKHNGGPVFDKISNYWNMTDLTRVLDYNLEENWEKLWKFSSEWSRQMFMCWYTEEEDVEVEGISYSYPRVLKDEKIAPDDPKGIHPGMKIKVSMQSKSPKSRGEEGIIKGWHPNGIDVKLRLNNGLHIKINHKFVIPMESPEDVSQLKGIWLEYIQEEM